MYGEQLLCKYHLLGQGWNERRVSCGSGIPFFFFFFSPSSLKDQTNIFACGIMLNSETHVFPWVVA